VSRQAQLTAAQILMDATRAQQTILVNVMATVTANSITAQNITDINAAITAWRTAVDVAMPGIRSSASDSP
jgi:hypothetical protein